MRKRVLLMIMTLLLLLTASAGAEEMYEKLNDALYRIVLRTDKGDTTLGSGVLFVDPSVILTAAGCCAEGDLYAIGADGEYAVASFGLSDSGVALLELAKPATGTPLLLTDSNAQSLPYILGASSEGRTGSVPLYLVRQTLHGSHDALLLTGGEGLLPGAFLADTKGGIIGLVLSQHMEGVGGYIALDSHELARALLEEEKTASNFLPATLSWADGRLNVSWQDGKRTKGVYVITVSGDNNVYYTTYEAKLADRSMSLSFPPGHTYYLQVQWAEKESAALSPDWDEMEVITIPAIDYTADSYQAKCFLVSAPAGADSTASLAEITTFTHASLTDPTRDILLHVESSYTVSAKADVPLAVELVGPDGQFYFEEMTFTFDPAYGTDDSFSLEMDELLASCTEFSGGNLKAGAYKVRFSLSGKVAGEYAFTVQEGDAASPAASPTAAPASAATSGFATGLAVKNESGLVTLSWDTASVPEGAKVHVYYFYEGNTYSTYYDMQPGSTSARIFTIPGRRMMAWVSWATRGTPKPDMPAHSAEDQYILLEATKETPLIAHGFKNLRIGLTPSADPNAATAGKFLPQQVLTRKILSDRSTPLYFQTEDSYRVSATSGEHPLLIVLMTPDGMCFFDPGYYTFDLSLQKSDLWLKDVSKLFADYGSFVSVDSWPAGEYRILYCIDGKVAGEYTFTLE